MPQIRKDYLLDKYVIIATERGKRPIEFASKKHEISPKEKCPLCPENEHMTPGVIDSIKESNGDVVRAIWNKYKAATQEGAPHITTHNDFYTFGNAVGDHEVVIETNDHGVEMEDLDEKNIVNVLNMIIKRINANYTKKGVKYVTILKNRGGEGGASLSHSHHQMIAYNIFPTEIKLELDAIKKYSEEKGGCTYCKIIVSEKDSDRKIFEDDQFVVFAPYASRFSMEAWILPKRCVHSITELSDDEINSLATILKNNLKTLDKLNYPAYNLLYKLSSPENKDYHFRIEIAPRLAKWAGFELITGTIINSMTPEDAAKFYRGEE